MDEDTNIRIIINRLETILNELIKDKQYTVHIDEYGFVHIDYKEKKES